VMQALKLTFPGRHGEVGAGSGASFQMMTWNWGYRSRSAVEGIRRQWL